jgi:hypothetical protein
MSYANKNNRDSADVAKLRKEYQNLATQMRETTDKGSAAALRDKKNKAHERIVQQVNGERAQDLSALHKVLIQQGRLKTPEQMEALRKEANKKS